jgi:2-polyprenyl-6-methoxyphenol hydroxylase-like FAD-dependent oxidoreductase
MAAQGPEVEVLIVGGGPVGLTARALLARWGVRAMLVEKYRELSPFPRSRLVNVRTMEIYRQLGLATKIRDRAFAREFGRVRFRDTLLEPDFATEGMIGVNAPITESPEIGALTSQDRLEPTLLAAADAETRFGVELVDLTEEAENVVAVLVDRDSGEETHVRARYVIAADGANSTVRQRLGIGTTGPGAVGRSTTVVFDADLARWSADQPAGVYFTAHGGFGPIYPEQGWFWAIPTPEDPEHADWHDLLSHAIGADLPVDVSRIQHWVVNAFIAEHFRHGRILLAGDAAHAVPPTGGMGMNVGVADVHNLCWKLAGILRGWAGPGLLETYEQERQPIAHETLRQTVANTQLMRQVQNRRREQLQAGETAQDQVELPWSEQYFAQLGLILGATYHSAAVLTNNGTPPHLSDIGTEYVPTAQPGHRMPHLWLTENRSTLDTIGEWFTLFTPNPAEWQQQTTTPWPLHIETLPKEHIDLCGISPQGALLVRPDGYIGACWPNGSTLQQALTTITSSPHHG